MDDEITPKRYKSNLKDEVCGIVKPLLPEGKFGDRPRTPTTRSISLKTRNRGGQDLKELTEPNKFSLPNKTGSVLNGGS